METDIKYDIALSFAGEDRPYVKKVADILKESKVSVFYDEFEESELWGKNLYTYLADVYKNHAKYTVIFCSKNYNKKLWTNHERENAQERAFQENSEYILPAKLDDTEIPGLKSTIAYVDLRKKTPYEFCELICKKLKVDIAREEVTEKKGNNTDIKPYLINEDSTVNFSDRFATAFPGLRGIEWFDEKNSIEMRLTKLLEKPLYFDGYNPIWWWRDGNLHIKKFIKISENMFLMNSDEISIKKIAAVNVRDYYQKFIYIETLPMPKTGLYDHFEESVAFSQKTFGYHREEYGLYDNKHLVTRSEYDDGAALINEELVEFNSDIELRCRYTTPYNFIIAAHGSPINNNHFDAILKKHLNSILTGESTLNELIKMILKLPKRQR